MAISQKTLLAFKKWRLILIQLAEGDHIITVKNIKERNAFKTSLYRENRKKTEYIYSLKTNGLACLISKSKRS